MDSVDEEMCARVTVLVNGSMGKEFRMERSLRQECLLSPLLFNLVAEAFLALVYQFEDLGWLRGMSIYPGC